MLNPDSVMQLGINDWMEMLMTLQSFSIKLHRRQKDDETSNFDPFTLKRGAVKKMIEIAKVPWYDDSEEEHDDIGVNVFIITG